MLCGCLFLAMAQRGVLSTVELTDGTILNGYVTTNADGSFNVETQDGDKYYYTAAEVKVVREIGGLATSSVLTTDALVAKKGAKIVFADSNQPLVQGDFRSPDVWQLYQRGRKQAKTGTWLIVSGAIMGGAAAVERIMYNKQEEIRLQQIYETGSYQERPAGVQTGYDVGTVLIVAGGASLVGGIIFTVIGNSILATIVKDQNMGQKLTLDFGAQQNGIGLALNF